ncbi:MAG: ComEC/Rec2 family competence protein [Oscillospiraceae bacterium]|nr:ComEC/Rec2 family competence protein [Oscillospiraceae bacterium]
MVRKMAYIGSSYLIGLFFASFLNIGANILAAASVVVVAVTSLILFGRKSIKPSVCMISAAAAILLYGLYDCFVYRNIVKYDGCQVEVKGVITDYTEYGGDKTAYTVKGVINGDVTAEVSFFTDSTYAEIGDSVTVTGIASKLKNSYTFPAEDYYKAKGMYLRINRVSGFDYVPRESFSAKRALYNYRDKIIDVIGNEMDTDGKAVMEAMIFGDKSELESTQKTLLYRAGIGHLMAVSGVHLSVVCSFFWLFISRLPINKYFRFGFLLVPIFCFAAMAGFSNSVIRAAIMTIIVYGASLFRRRADVFNSLGISVIILTIATPFAVRDASFLLSVGGVFAIGVAAPEVIKAIEQKYELGTFIKSVITSVCVTVMIFPITILFFDEVSIASPMSNLLLMPLCMLILVGGIIVALTGGVPFIAAPVLKICEILCEIVLAVSKFIGRLHFSYIPLGSDFIKLSAAFSVILVAVLFIVTKKSAVTAFASLAIVVFAVLSVNLYRITSTDISTAVFRDGSSTAVVVHNGNSAAIIDFDGGGAASSAVKYLNRSGIYKIDSLILNSGANASLPVYLNDLELFDLSAVMLPERDKSLAVGDCCFYEDSQYFDTAGCTLYFYNESVIKVKCRDNDIIFYTDASEYDFTGEYAAAVRYDGNSPDIDPDCKIIAVMSEKGEAVAVIDRTVHIGENVKITVKGNGEVTSETL